METQRIMERILADVERHLRALRRGHAPAASARLASAPVRGPTSGGVVTTYAEGVGSGPAGPIGVSETPDARQAVERPTAAASPTSGVPQRPQNEADIPTLESRQSLNALTYEELMALADGNWDSMTVLSRVSRAMLENALAWQAQYPAEWSGPARFKAIKERVAELQQQRVIGGFTDYAILLEKVLFGWNDAAAVAALESQLRRDIPGWAETLPSALRIRDVLEVCKQRVKNLARFEQRRAQRAAREEERRAQQAAREDEERRAAQAALAAVQAQMALRSGRQTGTGGSGHPAGVPEWPEEAAATGAMALGANNFFHASGMLRFMGYRVGRGSELTAKRRRAILTYVYEGALPLVNDRHYMAEWGKPRSGRRLRKLANTLAALARNARRKRTGSWWQAVDDWEVDLDFLRKRYYARRARDWNWPATVRRKRR